MKQIHYCLICLLVFFCIAGCRHESNDKNILEEEKKFEIYDQVADSATNGLSSVVQVRQNSPGTVQADWDKKIIRNAQLELEVKDYKLYSYSLREITKRIGGYISKEEQQQSEYRIENTVTLKVPVAQFDESVSLLLAGDYKIVGKLINSNDVTGEVVDIRSRMEAKKQIRARYLDFLKHAKNMQEVLQVQAVINDIQTEIEAASGRADYLTHESAMSTIQITFYQILNPSFKDIQEPKFVDQLLQAIKAGGWWMGRLLIVLLSLWPALLAVVLLWFIYKRRGMQKAKS